MMLFSLPVVIGPQQVKLAVQGTWTGIAAGWSWEGAAVQVRTGLDPAFCRAGSGEQLLVFF